MPDPETGGLHVDQVRRELEERRRAAEADEPAETRTHERRAERSSYLREKLRERADSEDEADRQDG
jgi:hypothetical protein